MRMEGKDSRRDVRKVMQVSEDWYLKEWEAQQSQDESINEMRGR